MTRYLGALMLLTLAACDQDPSNDINTFATRDEAEASAKRVSGAADADGLLECTVICYDDGDSATDD